MSDFFKISDINLAGLLSSRICHDLISPVGAINNSIELFNEGVPPEEIIDLLQTAAHSALVRLQFARMAFGSSGSASSMVNSDEAKDIAYAFIENEKSELSWCGVQLLLPRNKAQLLLNLLLVAKSAIPRGGNVSVIIEEKNEKIHFTLSASGSIVQLSSAFIELHSTGKLNDNIDAHSVQFYYTLLIARELDMSISLEHSHEKMSLLAF